MSVNQIILYVMVAFAVLGAADKLIGNRFGIGEKFEEGIYAMGPLSVSMVGILVLAPVLARWLQPVIVPVFHALGADPAMLGGSLLGIDMGGMPLAEQLAIDDDAAGFSGIIVGSMMGATLVFTIPVGLGIIQPEDRDALAKGILIGVITIPLGVISGGFAAGYSASMVLHNSVPILIMTGLIVIGVAKWQAAMIRGFIWFGKFITSVITIGLIAGIVAQLTGFQVFRGMTPIMDTFEVVAGVAIVLAGAFPLLHVITKVFEKPLMKLGGKMGVNQVAAAGFIASLANCIPMLSSLKDMDQRGKVINVAFAVSGGYLLGDHLGFSAGYCPKLVIPMMVGKIIGGVSAVALALWMTREKPAAGEPDRVAESD